VLAEVLVISVMVISAIAPDATAADSAYRVLVFSKTAGFRHDSIPAGIQAIRDLGAANNFTVDASEDSSAFNQSNLARYQAVIFLNTTGDILGDAQQTALENYVRGGGGWMGIHAAADTEYDWPFYGELAGAWFRSHPSIQDATVRVEDRAHAATSHLDPTWRRNDEWYNYRTGPRPNVHVLANLDESTYTGGDMGDHPTAWCHTQGSGRAFYTGGGHTVASYSEPAFRQHLLGGVRYVAGRTRADCRPENGYTALYNGSGSGSTAGWTHSGPGGFTDTDATLSSVGGLGLLWYSARKFGSYSLKLDWKLQGDDNSGVYVGVPDSPDPVNTAIDKGYEIQIDATDSPDRTTGAVYGFRSADIAARDANLNPPGEWNTYEIVVDGPRQNIQVYLNGVKINDFTGTDPDRDISTGYVGIQNHSDTDHVSFRNIRIKEAGGTPGDSTIQAENWSSASGVQTYPHAPAHNGTVLGFVDPGDWAAYDGVDLTGVTSLSARVASPGPSGDGGIEIRVGSPSGTLLGKVTAPNTGGWESYRDVSASLSNVPSGRHPLHLVFTGGGLDVDDFTPVKGTGGGGAAGAITGPGGRCVDVANSGTADRTPALPT
jgi:type 1 glutamine amidotransferase